MVTKNDIINGLVKIGIGKGDTVLIHSSLKSFGRVEGGVDTLLDALLEVITPDGNLMAPTLTGNENLSKDNPPVFDVVNTPCWTGIVPETFRKRPEAIRSLHPTHSVAVIGKDAEYLTACHETCHTPCGPNSPYDKLVKMNGYILMLGVDLESTTHFHYIEELVGSEYHMQRDWVDAKIILPDRTERIVTIKLHQYGTEREFMRMEKLLIEKDVLSKSQIGEATIRLIRAKEFTEVMVEQLQKDPNCLVK